MTTEIAMRRERGALVPVDEVSAEELRLIPDGQEVLVVAKMPRNIRQHRLAWALAKTIADSVDFLHDATDAMNWLKIKARHVTILQHPKTGQVAIVPKSIAFASLSQSAWARVFARMIYVTCADIIPGLKEGVLRKELELMVGAESPRRAASRPRPPRAAASGVGSETSPRRSV